MSSHGGGRRLLGRAGECKKLQRLISHARAGNSEVLVLRGEAGVGKTELLRYVVDHASGFRCVQLAGVQSDMELAFAGLQQLCAPLMGYVEELPDRQREALGVALGRSVGPTPDRFLVGLAVLTLIAACARDHPLLCVIDDAQWLDLVSVQVLGFVARRLLAEPVLVVFAVRDAGAEALDGLPEMTISGLSDSDARDLLESVVVGGIDPLVRDRIVAETRGIPLALLEVPRNVSAAELSGGFWVAGRCSSVPATEEAFMRRILALPHPTRLLLLLAAAEPVGDAGLFHRAAAQLGVSAAALDPAEAAGVIEIGARIRFHHPLMRSAAYRAADLPERRVIHRALAAATDQHSDPDRRAWHAANAAAGPDDAVAAELENSAARAQNRGGIAAAATFLERAAVLTADPVKRGARALAGAQAKRDAAAPAAANELLAMAELSPLSELQRAEVVRLRAQIEFARSRGDGSGGRPLSEPAAELLRAAQQLDGLDDELARETYLEALAAAMYAGRLGAPGAVEHVAAAARVTVDRIPELHRPIDFLLTGMADRITGGLTAGVGPLRHALELMCRLGQQKDVQALRWMPLGLAIVQESAAGELWDDVIWTQLATNTVRHARDTGALALLPPALVYRAGIHLLSGELTSATALLEEAASIAAATMYAPMRYHTLTLRAWRGIPSDAIEVMETFRAEAMERGEGRVLGATGYAGAILCNGLGRYEEAFAAAHTGCEYEDLGMYSWCLFELVEAATRTGHADIAEQAVSRLVERPGASGTDWGSGVAENARALVASDAQAEEHYLGAIESLERTSIVAHRARAHLTYGEWLRRVNRRVDARKQLNVAHDMYTTMGAQAFGERARRELVATGEKVRKQQVSPGGALTAQETQIARLAGDGLTNHEIGAQLFISTHTVEWHLRKVFAKFGITSRRQLRTISWASHTYGSHTTGL